MSKYSCTGKLDSSTTSAGGGALQIRCATPDGSPFDAVMPLLTSVLPVLVPVLIAGATYLFQQGQRRRQLRLALLREITITHDAVSNHLKISNYSAVALAVANDADYVPYVLQYPVPDRLFRAAIDDMPGLSRTVVDKVAAAWHTERAVQEMVKDLKGAQFKNMAPARRSAFVMALKGLIETDREALLEAKRALARSFGPDWFGGLGKP